jgi:hypothetical protein
LKENAVSEYAKGWASSIFDDVKRSFTDTGAGSSPGSE